MIDEYKNLLQIIVAQKEALRREDLDEVERLTSLKISIVEKIVIQEQRLNSVERAALKDAVNEVCARIVQEDEIFNLLLKEKSLLLAREIDETQESQGTVRKIGTVYGGQGGGDATFSGEG